MTTKKKAATLKKVVAEKSNVKKLTKAKAPSKSASPKIVTAMDMVLMHSIDDPKIWGTKFPGTEVTHFIKKSEAKKRVFRFNNNKKPLIKRAFMQPENIRKGIFLDLLNRPEVKYLRIYFGLNEYGKVRLIFVGADENHNDVYVKNPEGKAPLLQAKTTVGTDTGEDGAIDMSQGCPSYGSGGAVMLP
jgi:hypothetical protein